SRSCHRSPGAHRLWPAAPQVAEERSPVRESRIEPAGWGGEREVASARRQHRSLSARQTIGKTIVVVDAHLPGGLPSGSTSTSVVVWRLRSRTNTSCAWLRSPGNRCRRQG